MQKISFDGKRGHASKLEIENRINIVKLQNFAIN